METASETEAQLFVNNLFASFTASYTEPSVGFFETPNPNAAAITSISIPYDKNVTNPDGTTAIDSSILTNSNGVRKYQFVDPNTNASVDATTSGTPIYFRLNDTNFVRGTKYMAIQYDYIEEILPKEIFFITSQELLDMYPDKTPKEREYLITKEKKAVCLMQIGDKLGNGEPHDGCAPD